MDDMLLIGELMDAVPLDRLRRLATSVRAAKTSTDVLLCAVGDMELLSSVRSFLDKINP